MTIITSEIGINHSGDIAIAKKLMAASKWAGADFCKFQKRNPRLIYASVWNTPRESPWGTTTGQQKEGLELSSADYDEIDRYSKEIGMPWYASAWDIESQHFLKKYNLPYNKIASAMATNWKFIREVGKEHKPTFLSTGMCELPEIARGALILQELGCEVTLMHTVSTYPADEATLNLRCIKTLQERFNLPVGYSGHEASVSPSVVAVALGAVAVERHLTLDRSMYGSDQAASLEPMAFYNLVNQIRKIPSIIGDGVKRILPAEMEVAKKLRYWND